MVVLCHKPYQLEQVASEIAGEAKAVASVLGGTPSAKLQDAYPGVAVFKLMPNTPVEVRQGVTLYAPVPGVPPDLEQEVIALFERVGTVMKLEERLMEAAAAIMSVGPAYQALLAEAQVDAGVRHGLRPDLAGPLVAQTMAGSAALLQSRDYDTLAVRRGVTSPGGSTARGLAALEAAGIRTAFQSAIDAVILGGTR